MDNRYGTIFSTSKNNYFYDSGTGKVFDCNDEEIKQIEDLLLGNIILDDININLHKIIEDNNLFNKPKYQKFNIPSKDDLLELMNGNCEQIIVELTEACNLRCGYCVYNENHPDFRGFSNRSIDFNKIQKTLDYLLQNYKREEFNLTFYGGEPLLNFELMKKTIDYATAKFNNIDFLVSFTSNLTLLEDSHIDYFKNSDAKKITIMASIDGPDYIHDEFRKNINGDPTHELVIKKFNKLLSEFYDPDENRDVSINCVITPPYNVEKFELLDNYFYNKLQISKDLRLNYSYVDLGNMVLDKFKNSTRKINPIENYQLNNVINNSEDYYPYLLAKIIYRINNRTVTNGKNLINNISLHGNCIPGSRRLYLQTDGSFRICEKTGNAISIGNYKIGYDIDKIYEYYFDEYTNYFRELCSDCWASDLCDICYDLVMNENGIKPNLKETLCPKIKRLLKEDLREYFLILENDPAYIERVLKRYDFC